MSEDAYRPALALRNITRSYGEGHAKLLVFDNANLDLAHGEMVALVGPSGACNVQQRRLAGTRWPHEGQAAAEADHPGRLDRVAEALSANVGTSAGF